MQITLDTIPLIKLARKFSRHELSLKECKELVETVDKMWERETTNNRLSAAYTANHETVLLIYALASGDLDLVNWMLGDEFGCLQYTRGAWWAVKGALEKGRLQMRIDDLEDNIKTCLDLIEEGARIVEEVDDENDRLKAILNPVTDEFPGDPSPCEDPGCPFCYPFRYVDIDDYTNETITKED